MYSGRQADVNVYVRKVLPVQYMKLMSKLTKNAKMKKKAAFFEKMIKKMMAVENLFRHFVANDWGFESLEALQLYNSLDSEDQQTFNCNPLTIKWKECIWNNMYGIQKHLLKMDTVQIEEIQKQP
jgi:hypothetical protein